MRIAGVIPHLALLYKGGGMKKRLYTFMSGMLIGCILMAILFLLSGCAEHDRILYIKDKDTAFETSIYLHVDGDNLIYRRGK